VRTGRLGIAVGVAISLLLVAGVLWVVGFVGASTAGCPAGTSTPALDGRETPRSLWPPGAECAPAGPAEPVVAELVPGLGWAIVSLAFAGLAILATGLALEIRALRGESASRTPTAATQPGVRALAWPE
jgi:hypothetical protein